MAGADEARQDAIRELLERVVEALGLDGTVEVSGDGETITGTVHGEHMGLFIGRHGQTIDAVQHIAHRAVLALSDEEPAPRVVVDAEGYRARRTEALHRQADDAADDALRTGRPVALDAMSATERKVVHEHLKDREDVETYSEGAEPDRHLVVAPL
jgi:spoIIIJ-associated protein